MIGTRTQGAAVRRRRRGELRQAAWSDPSGDMGPVTDQIRLVEWAPRHDFSITILHEDHGRRPSRRARRPECSGAGSGGKQESPQNLLREVRETPERLRIRDFVAALEGTNNTRADVSR
jgi:hypothetical protein